MVDEAKEVFWPRIRILAGFGGDDAGWLPPSSALAAWKIGCPVYYSCILYTPYSVSKQQLQEMRTISHCLLQIHPPPLQLHVQAAFQPAHHCVHRTQLCFFPQDLST